MGIRGTPIILWARGLFSSAFLVGKFKTTAKGHRALIWFLLPQTTFISCEKTLKHEYHQRSCEQSHRDRRYSEPVSLWKYYVTYCHMIVTGSGGVVYFNLFGHAMNSCVVIAWSCHETISTGLWAMSDKTYFYSFVNLRIIQTALNLQYSNIMVVLTVFILLQCYWRNGTLAFPTEGCSFSLPSFD